MTLFRYGMLVMLALVTVQGESRVGWGAAPDTRVYVGTYTNRDSKGIYAMEFDSQTGQLSAPRLVAEIENPSFLAFHPTRPLLYSVCELSRVDENESQKPQPRGVAAYEINPETGALKLLNTQVAKGTGTCHLCVDRTGRSVVIANYGDGSSACLPLNDDGSLKPISTFIKHASADKPDAKAHGHSANMSPDNRFVLVADLGLDSVFVYRLDPESGKMTPNDPPAVKTHSGAGPRHLCFHPNGKFAYVNGEQDNTIIAYAWNGEKGILTPLMHASTLPADFHQKSYTAEVVVHPSGKFVYVSNRGHDSLAAFAIQPDGTVKPVGHYPSGGKTPRNFNIDPTGKWLLVANMDSDNLVVNRIDQETGALTPVGDKIQIPAGCCVKFLPMTR
ncbi:lactonase family protein [Planctomicrobium sp. SH664]|uniref:lactonase family protein n=1 Tax=Planctomicrobium sp. SH664 TaxID=3448125 RepID=UPI003F5B35FE